MSRRNKNFKPSIDVYHIISKTSILDKLRYGTRVSHYNVLTMYCLSDDKLRLVKTISDTKLPKEKLSLLQTKIARQEVEEARKMAYPDTDTLRNELEKFKIVRNIVYV